MGSWETGSLDHHCGWSTHDKGQEQHGKWQIFDIDLDHDELNVEASIFLSIGVCNGKDERYNISNGLDKRLYSRLRKRTAPKMELASPWMISKIPSDFSRIYHQQQGECVDQEKQRTSCSASLCREI